MSTFRYSTTQHWYKGNCHIHSTASDGGKSFPELARMYAGEGYDFLFRTDHWVASDVLSDSETYPLLWLDGMELHGRDYAGSAYHVVCLGTFEGLRQEMGFVPGLEAARAQGGLLILAHPQWMGNSLQEALRWGFDGVEVYNHVCHWLNGKSDGMVHWEAMLRRSPGALALAVDDAHIRPEHPGWNGAWVMVSADRLDRTAIQDALRAGRFYSTCGPVIHSLHYDGHEVTVETSPVQFVRLAGPGSRGQRVGAFDESTLERAQFVVPDDWTYAYIELEDRAGRRAWTNNLFVC